MESGYERGYKRGYKWCCYPNAQEGPLLLGVGGVNATIRFKKHAMATATII